MRRCASVRNERSAARCAVRAAGAPARVVFTSPARCPSSRIAAADVIRFNIDLHCAAALLRIGIDPGHRGSEDQQSVAILHDPPGCVPATNAARRKANHQRQRDGLCREARFSPPARQHRRRPGELQLVLRAPCPQRGICDSSFRVQYSPAMRLSEDSASGRCRNRACRIRRSADRGSHRWLVGGELHRPADLSGW